jgi:hypothetical protein
MVEFHFEPPNNSLYVSLAAIALGIGLCGFVALSKKSREAISTDPSSKSGISKSKAQAPKSA